MNPRFDFPRPILELGTKSILAGIALSFFGAEAFGRDPTGTMIYNPSSQTVEGVPRWVQSYFLNVTAPAPGTMNVVVKPTAIPGGVGVDEATARSFVAVVPSTVTFTSTSLTQQISVTVTMPDLGATTDLLFAYALQATAGTEVDLSAMTHTISARSTVPPPTGGSSPPTVTIASPSDGQVFTYALAQLPTSVPLQFQVASAADTPIVSVDVTLNGNELQTQPTVTYSSNNTIADGVAALPISAAGSHTVVVRGSNQYGMAYDSHSFTVNVSGPPPTIAITQPVADSDYTYFQGGNPVVVPNSFTATTPQGTSLQSWQATLTDPSAVSSSIQITPAVPTGRHATGSVQLALTTSGRYSLGVSAANQYGSASASTSFWINRVTNPGNQTVDAFQNATFAVTASGRASYSYEWYRQRGATVSSLVSVSGYSGATTAVLTAIGVTRGMSGDRYYCMITPIGSTGTIRSADAVLTVRKLTPTVTYPTPAPVVYGTALSALQKNATATYGAVTVPGTITYSPSSGVLPAGSQVLTASFAPSDTENYNSATGSTTWVVTKAVLTVAAGNKTKVYGTVNPTLTATISGFVNNETSAVITGAASLSTTASVLSGVAGSPYSITAALGTLQAANYSFAFVGGLLTVTPAPLEIRADNKSIYEGDPLPVLTATFVGLVNGETSVPGVSLTTTVPPTRPAGAYAIVVTVSPVANYSPISLVNGTLTIRPRGGSNMTISGIVFVDFSNAGGLFNGLLDANEPGLNGVVVQLFQGGQAVGTPVAVTTENGGAFSFTGLSSGTYTIDVVEPAGMVPTTGVPVTLTVSSNVTQNIGLALNLNAICNLRGDGYSHGYWKNNLRKALEGRTSGMQETAANLAIYTNAVSAFYLANPFGGITMQGAVTVLSGGDQLALQLLASEYNYVSGRLINNSRPLTFAFVAWGEYVLANPARYSSCYRTYVKDWMDAFNNSHGGLVRGPSAR